MRLLKAQQTIANEHLDSRIFLEGVAGTGKTRAAIERIKTLLKAGVRPDSILVWTPSAVLALPYRDALRRARVKGGSDVQMMTPGKLAYEMLNLFFPLIAEDAGFANPDDPPHFISLELVQYYMTRFIEPEIDAQDLFNSVHIVRNRLFTQIIDNLNKSALVGFDYHTIADQLTSAWRGEISQQYIYEDAQVSAESFRKLCLEHNLLDFSLQMFLFTTDLWKRPQVRRYLREQYRHLIVDNVEEETPIAHDILRDWLPDFESALVIYDTQAGYRRFLGADAIHAYTLKNNCEVHLSLDNHRVMSDEIEALQTEFAISLDVSDDDAKPPKADARDAIIYTDNVYYTQMVDWIVEEVAGLVHQHGVSPGEIVILAAYLPDALRFALQTRLDEQDIPNQVHRPSRALREEAATRTLITLAKLAHPHWEMPTTAFDVTYALKLSIIELDLVRAQLMVRMLYLKNELHSFDNLQNTAIQERITFEFGGRYEQLYQWLQAYQDEDDVPLDVFFSRLFGEVLSQPGFGFHDDPDAVTTAANLIDSAREFRQTLSEINPDLDTAAEYADMVDRGVIANQYIRNDSDEDVVRIMPAYTFLLSNQPVDYQFWVNVGSGGWSQRLHQPITHPYVLSRQWQKGRIWTDDDEVIADRETLSALALGLLRRCRKKVYLGISQFSEQGYEQRGPLLLAIQTMLRRLQNTTDDVTDKGDA